MPGPKDSIVAAGTKTEGAKPRSARPDPRLQANDRIGPYEVKSYLGGGGMGEVYVVLDSRLQREVALKLLRAGSDDPAFAARFEREAQLLAKLNHANIVTIYDFAVDTAGVYLVTELLVGETVRARLKNGPVELETAVSWAAQIADGLAAAHARDIVHRDIKPENLFITSGGQLKILDFGIAKVLDHVALDSTMKRDSTQEEALTGRGDIIGTIGYMLSFASTGSLGMV